MKTLNRQRKFKTLVERFSNPLGALLVASLLAGGCATTGTTLEAKAEMPAAQPPAEGERFFENKPLPEGPDVLDAYNGTSDKTQNAEPISKSTEASAYISRTSLDSFIEFGPQYALKLVTVTPAFQGRRFVGYEVVGFNPKGASLAQALKRGDIVTKINNRSIVRPEDYMAAWESLKSCESLRVKLIRAGEAIELEWPVNANSK